ncbi:hypothetical protein K438DRAFT_2011347 [Mycena galopus ATCC 62051]|nr:hypothetical protein K438DRAFT_2011347 [Mycena galopus ATCC 62051]
MYAGNRRVSSVSWATSCTVKLSSCASSPAPPLSTPALHRGLRNTLQIVVPAQYLVATSSTTKISSSPPSLARTSLVGAAVNAAPPADCGCSPLHCVAPLRATVGCPLPPTPPGRLELALRPLIRWAVYVEPYIQDVVLCARMRMLMRPRLCSSFEGGATGHVYYFALSPPTLLLVATHSAISTLPDPVAVYQCMVLDGVTASSRRPFLVLRVTPTALLCVTGV